jgi:hypothetical protein
MAQRTVTPKRHKQEVTPLKISYQLSLTAQDPVRSQNLEHKMALKICHTENFVLPLRYLFQPLLETNIAFIYCFYLLLLSIAFVYCFFLLLLSIALIPCFCLLLLSIAFIYCFYLLLLSIAFNYWFCLLLLSIAFIYCFYLLPKLHNRNCWQLLYINSFLSLSEEGSSVLH